MLGAITAPVGAILRVGNSIATGASNSGLLFARGKVSAHGRLRFPRNFGAKRRLETYNSELSQA